MSDQNDMSAEDQAAAVELMNRLVKPSLTEAIGPVFERCKAEGTKPHVVMMAICTECLLLAAYMHSACFGTNESFAEMALNAITHCNGEMAPAKDEILGRVRLN